LARSKANRSSADAARNSWAVSRGRLIYNLAILSAAAVCGLILAVAPGVFGATSDARLYGGVLAGYALVRGYYIYRRFRAHSGRPAANRQGERP